MTCENDSSQGMVTCATSTATFTHTGAVLLSVPQFLAPHSGNSSSAQSYTAAWRGDYSGVSEAPGSYTSHGSLIHTRDQLQLDIPGTALAIAYLDTAQWVGRHGRLWGQQQWQQQWANVFSIAGTQDRSCDLDSYRNETSWLELYPARVAYTHSGCWQQLLLAVPRPLPWNWCGDRGIRFLVLYGK